MEYHDTKTVIQILILSFFQFISAMNERGFEMNIKVLPSLYETYNKSSKISFVFSSSSKKERKEFFLYFLFHEFVPFFLQKENGRYVYRSRHINGYHKRRICELFEHFDKLYGKKFLNSRNITFSSTNIHFAKPETMYEFLRLIKNDIIICLKHMDKTEIRLPLCDDYRKIDLNIDNISGPHVKAVRYTFLPLKKKYTITISINSVFTKDIDIRDLKELFQIVIRLSKENRKILKMIEYRQIGKKECEYFIRCCEKMQRHAFFEDMKLVIHPRVKKLLEM